MIVKTTLVITEARQLQSRIEETVKHIALWVILFSGLSCSQVTSLSNRPSDDFTRPDGLKVSCLRPPPEIIAKSLHVSTDLAVERIGTLIKGKAGVEITPERIRDQLPSDVNTFEVVEYRLCVQYANGVLRPDEYKTATEKILPSLHKAYLTPLPSPTSIGKLGIWIAPIIGDNKQGTAQRTILESLREAVMQEATLKDAIEIRELPFEVQKDSYSEAEKIRELKTLQRDLNASILIWGSIVGFGADQFLPKVANLNLPRGLGRMFFDQNNPSALLEAIPTNAPMTMVLLKERLAQPLETIRLIVALSHMDNRNWDMALAKFNQLLIAKNGGVRPSALHGMIGTGLLNKCQYHMGTVEELDAGLRHLETALPLLQSENDTYAVAHIMHNLGQAYRLRAGTEMNEKDDQIYLERSKDLLSQAASLAKVIDDHDLYVVARIDFGLTLIKLSGNGDAKVRLMEAVNAFDDAEAESDNAFKERPNEVPKFIAIIKSNKAIAHWFLAVEHIDTEANYQAAIATGQMASRSAMEANSWDLWSHSWMNIGAAYTSWGHQEFSNDSSHYRSAIEIYELIAEEAKARDEYELFVMCHLNLGNLYQKAKGRMVSTLFELDSLVNDINTTYWLDELLFSTVFSYLAADDPADPLENDPDAPLYQLKSQMPVSYARKRYLRILEQEKDNLLKALRYYGMVAELSEHRPSQELNHLKSLVFTNAVATTLRLAEIDDDKRLEYLSLSKRYSKRANDLLDNTSRTDTFIAVKRITAASNFWLAQAAQTDKERKHYLTLTVETIEEAVKRCKAPCSNTTLRELAVASCHARLSMAKAGVDTIRNLEIAKEKVETANFISKLPDISGTMKEINMLAETYKTNPTWFSVLSIEPFIPRRGLIQILSIRSDSD